MTIHNLLKYNRYLGPMILNRSFSASSFQNDCGLKENLMPVKLLCLLNSKTSVTSILPLQFKRKHQINKVLLLQHFKSGNQFPPLQ